MAEISALPLLPLDDVVVLPGMVVPVQLSAAEVRAAVEAAQASLAPGSDQQARVLLVPRLDVKP
jgi:ATP-dependent Lon protease